MFTDLELKHHLPPVLMLLETLGEFMWAEPNSAWYRTKLLFYFRAFFFWSWTSASPDSRGCEAGNLSVEDMGVP